MKNVERLVDRIREQALLQDGGLEIGPGLLERGHEEVRARTRSRRRTRRPRSGAEMSAEMMPHDQPGDGDVGDPDIATDEEQHEQPDDRGDDPDRDHVAEERRRTAIAVGRSPKNVKSAPV